MTAQYGQNDSQLVGIIFTWETGRVIMVWHVLGSIPNNLVLLHLEKICSSEQLCLIILFCHTFITENCSFLQFRYCTLPYCVFDNILMSCVTWGEEVSLTIVAECTQKVNLDDWHQHLRSFDFFCLFSFFRLSLRSNAGFLTPLMNMDFCQSPVKVTTIIWRQRRMKDKERTDGERLHLKKEETCHEKRRLCCGGREMPMTMRSKPK